ncbi:MAG: insulinase family protein [Endomicrobium sp.]|nr:insulinase family protein [Endomicrobium sp.]
MKYENGLTLVLKNDKNSLVASVVVFVRTGSVDEKPSQAGLSHFLEHLMFKGSKNYPGDLMSRNVENIGGYINAATVKEYTMYYISIQKDGVEECIKMLADTMQNPLFPQDEVDRERKVVIEEIQRYFDNPGNVLYGKFNETIYTKSALKNSVIGKSQVIASVSCREIYDYYKTHYVPGNMVVVVSGNFNETRVKKLIGETFGQFIKRPVPPEPLLVEDIHDGKDIVEYENVEIGYMLTGFLGPDLNGEDIYVANLAADVLGGGKSSRLYRYLYEEKHLVFSIGSSFMAEKGTGNVYIMSVFNPQNMKKIKDEIKNQIQNITDNGITQEELNRAKLSLKTSFNFSLETSIDIAENLGYWYLMGNPAFAAEYMRKLDKMTAGDVNNFFKKYYLSKIVSNVALLPKSVVSGINE